MLAILDHPNKWLLRIDVFPELATFKGGAGIRNDKMPGMVTLLPKRGAGVYTHCPCLLHGSPMSWDVHPKFWINDGGANFFLQKTMEYESFTHSSAPIAFGVWKARDAMGMLWRRLSGAIVNPRGMRDAVWKLWATPTEYCSDDILDRLWTIKILCQRLTMHSDFHTSTHATFLVSDIGYSEPVPTYQFVFPR